MTIIVRDRANDDKVVKVIEPLNTTKLTYNEENENRLAYVTTDYPNYNGFHISQINKLNYGDYLNSDGEIDNVVLSVEQRTDVLEKLLDNTKVTRTCTQCPIYDNLAEEIEILEKENEANANGGA